MSILVDFLQILLEKEEMKKKKKKKMDTTKGIETLASRGLEL